MSNRLKEKELTVEYYFTAVRYNTGFIEILWDTSITEITVDHLKKSQIIVKELSGGKKMPLYFSTHDFLGISKEARKYATSPEGVVYTKATAVLVNNMAIKILMSFFMSMNKPIVPTKGFVTKEECFVWLEKIAAHE